MRDIEGYEGLYAVTSCGKVWSYKSKKFLKPFPNNWGYLQVKLCKDGKKKNYYIHRLVGQAFIPNPDNLETIDHINWKITENNVNNLQWLSREENATRWQPINEVK